MKDESLTLTGWQAVPVFLTMMGTQVLTALAMALPITWLVNHIFASGWIRVIFAGGQFGYWQCVGIYAIWFTAKGRIKWSMKS